MFNDPIIRPFEKGDILMVKELTDQEIGKDYYSLKELTDIQERSIESHINCSLVLEVGGDIKGIRLTYPPGKWQEGKGKSLLTDKWPFELKETAYFQSLFLSLALRNQGWGKKLSNQSIKQLKNLDAKGVVCHSWKESPENSSSKYLKSLGFKTIGEHREYWKFVDYICPRCGKPCVCTAEEMYLEIK